MAPWRQRSAQTAAAAAAADAAAALKHVFVIQSFPSESGNLQNTEGGVRSEEDHGKAQRVHPVSGRGCTCLLLLLGHYSLVDVIVNNTINGQIVF